MPYIDPKKINLNSLTWLDGDSDILVPLVDVKKAIAQTPTEEDVVKVVRCINCEYWDGMGYEGRCEAPTNGLIHEYTNYDDFCSYGERRDNEQREAD